MTHSQINQPKGWGFSRRTPNLNQSAKPNALTSIQLRRCFPFLKYLGYKNHFGNGFPALWATGYYCGSAGHISQEAVARYIAEQQGKEVFEYSIFGNPQTKIGDFT